MVNGGESLQLCAPQAHPLGTTLSKKFAILQSCKLQSTEYEVDTRILCLFGLSVPFLRKHIFKKL